MTAQFPDAIYTPRTMVNRTGVTYDAARTKDIYAEDFNKDRDEIVAIETILGTNPEGAYDTVDERIAALEGGGGGEAFPVGSVYISVNNTNPATSLGYGTWSQFGKGKCLVGQDPDDPDFDTAEETIGEKTHQLSAAELATHSHKVDPPATNSGTESADHTHGQQLSTGSNNSSPYYGKVSARDSNPNLSPSGQTTGRSATHYHAVNIAEFDSGEAGSDSAHNNIQPSIVVYFWKRTE